MPSPIAGDLLICWREVEAEKEVPRPIMKWRGGQVYPTNIPLPDMVKIKIKYEKNTPFLVTNVEVSKKYWINITVMDPNDMSLVIFRVKNNGRCPNDFLTHIKKQRRVK